MPRACGECTLCCKVLAIAELGKPKDSWCTHCKISQGCTIYDKRPSPCRSFNCGYLSWDQVPERWFPAKCKMVIAFEQEGKRIVIHVDPSRPDAWLRHPYYEDIKGLAKQAADGTKQVIVYIGSRQIIIFPERDVDLGVCTKDDRIFTYQRKGARGLEWHAEKLHKDDPRISRLSEGVVNGPATKAAPH